MEYKGKLFGRICGKYFDTGKTADDWDNLEKYNARLLKIIEENKYSESEMIESAKYGYEYHTNTSFPDESFKDNCENNFLQFLKSKRNTNQ